MRNTTTWITSTLVLLGLACTSGQISTPASFKYPVDTTSIEPGQQLENAANWYHDAVVYHIWVKAFNDGIYQDGIGDLPGIQAKLDYLQSLGVNTLWLSPIFECDYKGENMHGYDTVDYTAINDRFGQKADLKRLIDAAHARSMRVLFDFVPNHTSTKHRWFTEDATRSSWYLWQNTPVPGWGFPWGGGAPGDVWKYFGGGYFYTSFGVDSLADLNFNNPDVRKAIQGVQKYWLDRGFDGMRVDAVRYLHENGAGKQADQAETHAQLKAFRAILDEYASGSQHPHPGDDPTRHSVKVMMAEAWADEGIVGQYFGNGSDEFNLCLDFGQPWAIQKAVGGGDGAALLNLWESQQRNYPAGFRMASFDSNHDNLISRPGTTYQGDRARIIQAEALNLLSPGTPIIYYGNEVGMPGKSGRDLDLRQPMDWTSVAVQSEQPDSILSWTKYLLKARNSYPALRGSYTTLTTDVGTTKAVAYLRSAGAERVFVVTNLTDAVQTVVITDLTRHGVSEGAVLNPILGDLKGSTSLEGTRCVVKNLPPHGVRVVYAAGGAFQGTIHGDLP